MYKYLQTARIVLIGLFLCMSITPKGIAQILDNNFDDHDGQLYFYEPEFDFEWLPENPDWEKQQS